MYEKDILAVMISARNILGEKYQSSIREYLLGNKDLKSTEEFNSLDAEILETITNKEIEKLALEEKRKISKLVKEKFLSTNPDITTSCQRKGAGTCQKT